MLQDGRLVIAKGEKDICLAPEMANRHGLIAGATGTGKTVTLKTIAESLSAAGVPVFISDVKGDVSGMGVAGEPTEKLVARLEKLGIHDYPFQASTVEFWDVYGEKGVPVRTSISEMGPLLLARLLGLTDVQQGVLNIVFRVADDMKLLLIDLKDLRSMLAYVGEHSEEYTVSYGNVSKQSIGAIQRALLQLEDAGGDLFFGEPTLQIQDWLRIDEQGRGIVNILHCARLFNSPLLYSTFLLWMLTELYENLPEVGDLDRPKICFFFDEAHLLFDDTPGALVDKIEQIVKLIRSKGVGVYFITQNPADIPDSVLAQLGNRVQHALRAYTPKEQRGVKAAAESFRVNPAFKTEDALQDLATGEALISFLDEDGRPDIVQRAMVIAPMCSMGAMDDETRAALLDESDMLPLYRDAYDPESAYEILAAQVERDAAAEEAAILAAEEAKEEARRLRELEREQERQRKLQEQEEARLIRLQQQEEAKIARLREQEALKLERIREQEMIRRRREQEQEMARREREAQKQREQMQRDLIKAFTPKSSTTARRSSTTKRTTSRSSSSHRPATTRKPAPRQTPMERQVSDAMTTVGVQLARGILGMLKL